MKLQDKPSSFKSLEEDIQRFRQKTAPEAASGPQNAGLAMRMGLELVAGVAVGAGAGIMLDRWLGTTPLLLVICFFLGAAGGSLNLYRLAKSQSSNDENTTKDSND